MGFCTFCGKQLADGEVCNCEQSRQARVQQAQQMQQQPQGNPYGQPQGSPYGQPQQFSQNKPNIDVKGGLKDAFTYVKSYVKDPIDSSEEFYNKKSMKTSIVLVIVSTVSYVLAALLNLVSMIMYQLSYAKRGMKIFGGFGMSFNELLEAAGETRWDILHDCGIHGWNFIQVIFFPIIYVALMTAAAVGISLLVQKVVMKEKADISKAAALAGSASVPFIGMLLISIINNFINVEAFNGLIFPIFIKCLGILAIVQGCICLGHDIKDNKKLVISIAMFVAALMIVNYLVKILIFNHCPACFTLM